MIPSEMQRPSLTPLIVLAAASLSGCMSSPMINASALDYKTSKDVIFTPASWPAPLVADIYQPASEKPTPAVLLIHGGGWNGKERRSDMTAIAKSLAKRGYFVMNATYRLTPDWKFPAQTEDINEALAYLRRNATDLNLDPDRIGTFGYSAGAHLASLAGLDPKNHIKVIVSGGTPADLRFWPDGRLTGLLLGGPLKGNEAIYREASPVTHVTPKSPPVFLYHGTADTLVPIEHAHAYIASLEKNQVTHEVYWIEGRSHVMAHLFPAQAISKAIDFLDQHLK
ncbi:MAG: alpha/beta hydrolase [Akkermansiaceae bacterium]|jgi:acetyl esterase/lipase|nr:alpha/beta hydrolase [Akkermansiaceae bacterium]MDP4647017.1 alpha/beta hydrolase [Akkermansiaceae bacterium]MDP4996189.1 alpha/beta hydrolase [Akkermansiaceae bacterium]